MPDDDDDARRVLVVKEERPVPRATVAAALFAHTRYILKENEPLSFKIGMLFEREGDKSKWDNIARGA